MQTLQPATPATSAKRNRIGAIRAAYLSATAVSFIILVIAYLFIFMLTQRQVNIAALLSQRGMQRARTYQIESFSVQLLQTISNDERMALRTALQHTIAAMRTSFDAFVIQELPSESPEIQTLYTAEFTQLLNDYLAAGRRLAAAPDSALVSSNPDYGFIITNTDDIFANFMMIVAQFEREAVQGAQTITVVTSVAAALLLLTFLAEIPLIFRPMERRILERERRLKKEIQKNQAVNALLLRTQADQMAMMESAPRGLMAVEFDGTIRTLNPAAKRIIAQITGSEPMVGSPMRHYISSEDLQDFERNFALASAGEHVSLTRITEREDGTKRHYWLQYYPIKVPDTAQILSVGFSIEDLSELHRLQSAQRKSEERYRVAIDATLDAFYLLEAVYDPNGTVVDFRFVDINRRAEIQLGMAREALIGNLICEVFPINRENGFFEQYRQVLQQQKPMDQEYEVPEGYPASGWYYQQVIPLTDGVAIINRDITKRKLADAQALAIAFEDERRRILADFITSASHEFRTPLTVIDTTLYLLDRTLTEPAQHARIERIQQQSEFLLKLVEGLVMMLGLDNLNTLKTEPVNLKALLLGILDTRKMAFERSGLHLSTALQTTGTIQGDASSLVDAFGQLLDNTLHYTPRGGTVHIASASSGGQAHITIQDSGIGIGTEQLPHIFERFYRADSAHSTRGIGLGLSIAKRIFDLHDAGIVVESTTGVGTTVTVVFPQRR